jgi:hypothetical protein
MLYPIELRVQLPRRIPKPRPATNGFGENPCVARVTQPAVQWPSGWPRHEEALGVDIEILGEEHCPRGGAGAAAEGGADGEGA